MVKHQEGQLNYNQETKLNRSTNDITVITEVRGHLGMVNTSGEIVDQPYFHWSINQPLISRLLRVNNPSGFPWQIVRYHADVDLRDFWHGSTVILFDENRPAQNARYLYESSHTLGRTWGMISGVFCTFSDSGLPLSPGRPIWGMDLTEGGIQYGFSVLDQLKINRGMSSMGIFDQKLIVFIWLVVWNVAFMTFYILGMSSSQLTNSYFSEG